MNERVAIIGAGTMGAGIARVFAPHCEVRVFDPVRPADDLPAGVLTTTTLGDAVADATVIIETVTEDLAVKRAVFAELEALENTGIWASNSSTFAPSEIAAGRNDPSRVINVHFFNPADVVPLVEVVPAPSTDAAVIDQVMGLLGAVGKVPVLLKREVDGFVANRLQAALVREALALVESGVVSVEELDLVVTAGLGPRWAASGPLMTMDLGGLDVWKVLADRLFPQLDASTGASPTLRALVAEGALGAKTGRGFYVHSDESTRMRRAAIGDAFDRGR